MLSKKMAVSLTSLIIIFALAFVVPAAMAGDFSTAITVAGHDISHADGEQRQAGTQIVFKVTFGQIATHVAANAAATGEEFAATDLIMQAYNEDGVIQTKPSATIGTGIPNNGKNYTITMTPGGDIRKLYLQIPQGKVGAADPTVGDGDDANEKKDITVHFLPTNPDPRPDVLRVARVGEAYAVITSAEFMVHVLLTEEPKGGFTKDHLALTELDFGSIVKLASPTSADIGTIPAVDRNGDNDTDDTGESALSGDTLVTSWRDSKFHLYLVTLKTKPGEKTAVVGIKSFAGMENPAPGTGQEMYNQLSGEGRDQLTVMTKRDDPAVAKPDGNPIALTNKRVLPEDGYLIVATDPALTGINLPDAHDADDNSPKIDKRTPAELKYNVIKVALPDLEAFLVNGGTIDLVAPDAGISISEIMWGSDASLATNSHSQWIEIKNTSGGELKTGDGTYKLIFYGPNEKLPDRSVAANNIQDRVGTIDDNNRLWSVIGKGQNGRSGHAEQVTDLAAVVPTRELISMYRVETVEVGNTAAAWMQSKKPAVNIDGANRVGSPGDEPHEGFAPPPTQDPDPVVIPAALSNEIAITEIMVDTDNGRLPQWIELTYSGTAKASLKGWEMRIDNAADPDVLGKGSIITVSLGDVIVDVSKHTENMGKGQSVLVVAWEATRKSDNIREARVINLASQLGQTSRYQLLSYNGFKIALVPPKQTAIADFGDIAGNLHEGWDIEMSEGAARSSLIRYDTDIDGAAILGTDANGWRLAAAADNLGTAPISYYGDDEDNATPGQHDRGPLPVELSHFRPARDKATGAVVITWATQSELNNAGFFIKRSQQRDGEFKVINAAMIPGAGTTSEKQFYTYTDTTAQPNVVYYYQIEDVSLDGNRQTLTRGIRLKGHIGAAGKLTSIWGELKSSNE